MRLLRLVSPLLAAAACLLAAPAVQATPVAGTDAEYAALGRVFPDPLGGCQQAQRSPCSPNAQGHVPAQQFIGVDEFVKGIEYLNSKSEWQRYLEVWPLDGRKDANEPGTAAGTDELAAFPGNNLGRWEFSPRAEYRSAGIPTTGNSRRQSDLYVLRVTDERVPDAGKKRYAVSLSIHGIERAGVEGGTRAVEDLVTAFTTQRDGRRIVPDGTIENAPTFADVLQHAIVYFAYPNPDGWRRGSVSSGGLSFQRYNGNGVDLNRDWPDVGFAFRPYSPLSEPESRALAGFFSDAKAGGARFDAGVDLHGQLTADALSYTLIGHGKHDFAKDIRLREGAKAIHRVSEKALAWSPMIVPNDTPKSQNGCAGGAGVEACARIYGQTWGTVYDTINYTTTGTLGDWMDSPVGLDADGLDNEMSFSHLDRNIVFDPHGEQLHVDGNKALIYAQISQLLRPPGAVFQTSGRKGYVPNRRLARAEQDNTPAPPPGTVAQAKITGQTANDVGPGQVIFDFPVKLGRQGADGGPDAGKDVFNGGLRVDITKLNAAGISDGNAVTTLKVQCRGCDDHPGIDPAADGYITVAEDFNQSPGYAQAGLTAAVNRPLAKNREGKVVEWRALLETAGGAVPNLLDAGAEMDVTFFQGPATASGDTSGAAGPRLRAYDVANTDFLAELNRHVPRGGRGFEALDPKRVAAGTQSLNGFTSIVLADDPLPGYTGPYGDVPATGATGAYTVAEKNAFFAALRRWVSAGGNLVLTDGALRALPEVSGVPPQAIGQRKLYVGQVAFKRSASESTVGEPLVGAPNPIAQDGARFNSDDRRQTYEPTPLGFAIQHTASSDGNAIGDDAAESPAWDVDAGQFRAAGGRVLASAIEAGATGSSPEYTRAAMGEIKRGSGQIRMLGALIPQPSTAFDHDFGLEPYAVTYTGWLLFCNMLGADCAARASASEVGGPAGSGPTACPANNGFRSASARPRGRRVRMGFSHRGDRAIRVDVFQVSQGRRVLKERLVARFKGRKRGFTWNGRANRKGRRITDGHYFVRMRTRTGSRGQLTDTRRIALQRVNGRFKRRPSFHRRTTCGTLQAFKLQRPVFGGPRSVPLRINYRLRAAARVRVQVRRGGKAVRTFKTRARRAHRTYRLRVSPAATARRGSYKVRIRVQRGSRRTAAVLTSRRL